MKIRPSLNAIVGGIIWLALAAALRIEAALFGTIELILLLGVLTVVPLCLELVAMPNRSGRHCRPFRAAWLLHPFAAGLVVISFFLPKGIWAAGLTLGWVIFSGMTALYGLVRFLPRSAAVTEEICIDAGLVYISIGSGWLFLSRLGAHPLGFGDTIVLLTAVHFHYAGFAAPILAGLAGRKISQIEGPDNRLFQVAAFCIVSGTPLVAAGITFSPPIELIGAFVLSIGLFLLGYRILFTIVPVAGGTLFKGFLVISGLSSAAAMGVACLYAIGEFREVPLVGIPNMVRHHGWINSVGFTVCGLIAWSILRPASHLPAPGIPFSRLFSRGRVGPDFFQRIGAVGGAESSPHGLVDDLDEYRRSDFDTQKVDPGVRAFYERTDRHDLRVRPIWRPGVGLLSRVYKHLSSRTGQMNFPRPGDSEEEMVDSRILPIVDSIDGRTQVRAWVRTYARTGEALYMAAYAAHSLGKQTYMNIAFPLPYGNLTSVLRLEPLGSATGSTGVLLTTFSNPSAPGDEGVYWVCRLIPIRLPINETIRVWAAEMPEVPGDLGPGPKKTTVFARHEMSFFGIHFLTLDYWIFPKDK